MFGEADFIYGCLDFVQMKAETPPPVDLTFRARWQVSLRRQNHRTRTTSIASRYEYSFR